MSKRSRSGTDSESESNTDSEVTQSWSQNTSRTESWRSTSGSQYMSETESSNSTTSSETNPGARQKTPRGTWRPPRGRTTKRDHLETSCWGYFCCAAPVRTSEAISDYQDYEMTEAERTRYGVKWDYSTMDEQNRRDVPWKRFALAGRLLVEDARSNKGMAFSWVERRELNLHGLLPPRVESIQDQAKRVLWNFDRMKDNLEKYQYIMNLAEINEQLFFYVISENVKKMMPIVYTPTVGLGCQRFGYVYQRPRGMFITINDVGRVYHMFENWPENDIRALCFTDGERILGLGDLGCFGMGIPIGKLALYTACAGIKPYQLLPVMVDVGCNTKKIRDDQFYIGLRQERDRTEKYDALIDEIISAAQRRWGPHVLLQFEDFGNRNAFRLLQMHKDRANTFNDDIQGTASVALAGIYTACRMTNTKISDHRFLMFGAGSAGLGIASLICTAMVEDDGLTLEDARKHIYLVDSRGLVVKGRSTGGISKEKSPYVQEMKEEKDLGEIAEITKATAIIGVSGQAQVFTEAVCRQMAINTKNPMIFPMSNPTHKAECSAADAYKWTDGNCIFASGSPFPALDVKGVEVVPSQGNNAYIFPGLALGLLATKALRCPDNFFTIAAKTLAGLVTDDMMKVKSLYPPLEDIRKVSFEIAVAIGKAAFAQGLATEIEPKDMSALIKSVVYDHTTYPVYSNESFSALSNEYTKERRNGETKIRARL